VGFVKEYVYINIYMNKKWTGERKREGGCFVEKSNGGIWESRALDWGIIFFFFDVRVGWFVK
jgi:hypothetical protein